jgi:peptidoglycan/xylan/chitin deacetylase (PgdA/CDA1 family)
LVLHRIVRDAPTVWEDVHEQRLREIITHIGELWAVFSDDGVMGNARWMLTFDDGCASDYEIAFPLLLEAGIAATFFLITDRVGKPGNVSWAQVEEMNRYGMCIGSHSGSHRSLIKLNDEQVKIEFERSKRQIEERIGAQVAAFSYPFGASNARLHALGFAAGYRYLCTSSHGVVSATSRIFPRNSINSAMDLKTILRLMEPTAGTRLRWCAEDVVKRGSKQLIGEKCYALLRDVFFLRKE